MFEPASRYYHGKDAQLPLPCGSFVVYKRRLRTSRTRSAAVRIMKVDAGDRPDLLAAKALGDPAKAWVLAEANRVLDPWSLSSRPGATISVPATQGVR